MEIWWEIVETQRTWLSWIYIETSGQEMNEESEAKGDKDGHINYGVIIEDGDGVREENWFNFFDWINLKQKIKFCFLLWYFLINVNVCD